MNCQRRHDVGSPQARLMGLRCRNLAQWLGQPCFVVALLAVAAVCVPATQASGEWVVLTLEAYAPSTLPARSTTLEVADVNDQLEISRQAVLFAISDSGWNLGAVGGQLHSLPTPQVTAWVWGISNILPSMDGNLAQRMGYDLNAEAVANPGPNGPEYFLFFHTDAWAERLDHNWGEEPNNFGSIAGCTGGVWFHCPVPHWGRFSVEPVPEPATLALLLAGGAIALCRKRRGKALRALCLAFASVALVTTAAYAGPNFGSPQNYAVGAHPQDMAAGDFNRDGKLDFAVENRDDGDVAVLYAQPSGGFGGRQDYAVGTYPGDMAIGDFNTDGYLDLATANMQSNNISILYGQSGGAFGGRQDYSIAGGPHYISTAHLNADGRLDLLTANYYAGTITLLYGQAGGGFGGVQSLAVGSLPHNLVATDLNRDGVADIAVAVAGASSIGVLYGQQGGGFAGQVDFATGSFCHAIGVADFDRDGWLDLSSSNYLGNSISILYGGPGGLGQRQDYDAGSSPGENVTADFNGDGIPDLAITSMGDNNVSVFFGQPDGSLGGRQDYPVGGFPAWIIAADLDANGGLDLVVSNSHDNTISVLYNTTPEPATLSLLAVGGLMALRRRR